MNQASHAIPYMTSLDDSQAQLNTRHGVFYPKGFIVLAYASAQKMAKAWADSWQNAVTEEHRSALNSAQMREICDRSDENASAMAKIAAAELKQIDIFRQLADGGGEFLIVNDDAIDDQVLTDILREHKPAKALRYGLLTTEELIEEDADAISRNPMGQNERNSDKVNPNE